jgi:putative acetyltransferase
MFVRDGMRGRRIGEQVLHRLEASAIERGAGRVLLLTGPRQPDAIRLYERNGYRVRGPFGGHAEHPLNIFYEKAFEARV